MSYDSWGRYRVQKRRVLSADSVQNAPINQADGWLPFGNGRSYGDPCHNDSGCLIDSRDRRANISFDESTGSMTCEAGVLLSDILAFSIPRGYFPTVTPGTQFVTLAGAIANDEGLIENAAVQGDYLIDRLKALRSKYPKIIKDVRGQGLMIGLEFQGFSQTLPAILRPVVSVLDDKLKGSLSGFIGALLLRDYDTLVAFTEYNRNVIRLEPALICSRANVDQFVDALDTLLGRGIVNIVKDFVASQLK